MDNIKVIFNNSCHDCGKFSNCDKRSNTTCQTVGCNEWEIISNNTSYIKTNGEQIHECLFCGHKYWD